MGSGSALSLTPGSVLDSLCPPLQDGGLGCVWHHSCPCAECWVRLRHPRRSSAQGDRNTGTALRAQETADGLPRPVCARSQSGSSRPPARPGKTPVPSQCAGHIPPWSFTPRVWGSYRCAHGFPRPPDPRPVPLAPTRHQPRLQRRVQETGIDWHGVQDTKRLRLDSPTPTPRTQGLPLLESALALPRQPPRPPRSRQDQAAVPGRLFIPFRSPQGQGWGSWVWPQGGRCYSSSTLKVKGFSL